MKYNLSYLIAGLLALSAGTLGVQAYFQDITYNSPADVEVVSGDIVTYTIQITNTGQDTAWPIISDFRPATLSAPRGYIQDPQLMDTPLVPTTGLDGSYRIPLGAMATDENYRIVLTGRVLANNFAPFANSGKVDYVLIDGTTAESNTFMSPTTIFDSDGKPGEHNVILDFQKTLTTPQPHKAGDPIAFALTIHNYGAADATGVAVTDDMTSLQSPLFTLTSSNYSFTSPFANRRVFTGLTVPAKSAITIYLTGQAGATAAVGDGFANVGTMRMTDYSNGSGYGYGYYGYGYNYGATGANLYILNAISEADVQVVSADDVALTMAPWTTVGTRSGDLVQYQLKYQNHSDHILFNVPLTVTLPPELQYSTLTDPAGTVSGQTVTRTIPVMWTGTYDTVLRTTLRADYNQGRVITTTGTIGDPTTDATPADNTTGYSFTIPGYGDLAITKTLDTGTLLQKSGDIATFHVTLTNIGTSAVTGIILVDTLTGDLSFVDSSLSGGRVSGKTVVRDSTTDQISPQGVLSTPALASLASGATITFTVRAALTANDASGTLYGNTITASSSTPDSTSGNNTATALGMVNVIPAPILTVTKTFAGTSYPTELNDTADYTVVVSNVGTLTATGVTLTEVLPAQLTLVTTFPDYTRTLTTAGVVISGLPDITPGGNDTVTIRTRLAASYQNTTQVINKIIAAANGLTGITATATNTITRLGSDLSVTQSISQSPIQNYSGNVFAYSVVVHNVGTTPANNTRTLTDTLPAGLTVASTSPTATINGNVLTWTSDADLTGGAAQTFTINVRVASFLAANITNRATITTSDDTNTSNNSVDLTTSTSSLCGNGIVDYNAGEQCDGSNMGIGALPGQVCSNTCSRTYSGVDNRAYVHYCDVNGQNCGDHSAEVIIPLNTSNAICTQISAETTLPIVTATPNVSVAYDCKSDTPGTIQLNCGDASNTWQTIGTNTTSARGTCAYTSYANYQPKCRVNANDAGACVQTVLIRTSRGGACGNGQMDAGEQCDLGATNNTTIGDWLDNDRTVPSTASQRGQVCGACQIGSSQAGPQEACSAINSQAISIEKGEYLPFRWDIPNDSVNSCGDAGAAGKILRTSLKCSIDLIGPGGAHTPIPIPLNGSSTAGSTDCSVDGWTVPGSIDPSNVYPLFKYFQDQYFRNITTFPGRFYVSALDLSNQITAAGGRDLYGEYKLQLNMLSYKFCDKQGNQVQGIPRQRVCQVDFAVTKPYLMQQGASSAQSNESFSNFYAITPTNNTSLLSLTDMGTLGRIATTDFNGGSQLPGLLSTLTSKYTKLAVAIKANVPGAKSVLKVPGQNIYIINGDGAINISQFAQISTPFTFIINAPRVIIDNNISANAMIISQGTIRFDVNSCQVRQTVNGIYIAKGGFERTAGTMVYNGQSQYPQIINNNFNNIRCNDGGLTVNGLLIGPNINNIVASRRSSLNTWFNSHGTNIPSVLTDRRNDLYNGASLLIKSNATLWTTLPPGALDLDNVLRVYRQ